MIWDAYLRPDSDITKIVRRIACVVSQVNDQHLQTNNAYDTRDTAESKKSAYGDFVSSLKRQSPNDWQREEQDH